MQSAYLPLAFATLRQASVSLSLFGARHSRIRPSPGLIPEQNFCASSLQATFSAMVKAEVAEGTSTSAKRTSNRVMKRTPFVLLLVSHERARSFIGYEQGGASLFGQVP